MVKRGFRSDIQGLRAVAVTLVVLYHAQVSVVSGGYIGVDVFFVVSGFLITSHLVAPLFRGERIRFGEFYARRARRILPASLVVLVLTAVAGAIFLPPLDVRGMFNDAIATALYAPNILFAVQGTNYLSESTPSLFQHYWSLGVEEQFYLVWPALIALAFFIVRKSRRSLFIVLVAIVVLSFAACLVLTVRSQPLAFFLLPTRAWELGVGGIIGFASVSGRLTLKPVVGAVLSWAGLAIIVSAAFVFDSDTLYPGFNAAVPVLGAALLLIGGESRTPSGAVWLLKVRPFQWLGLISYSLYLVHWPLLVLPQEAVGVGIELPVWIFWLLGTLSVPLAWLLYRFVEDPVRKLPALTRRPARATLIVTVIASLVIVGGSFAGQRATNLIPLYTDTAVAVAAPSAPPVATTFVPRNLAPGLRQAAGDNPIIYSDGCHLDETQTEVQNCVFGDTQSSRTIALFGDSHAAQWFPALDSWATENDFRLMTYTKSSCPSVDIRLVNQGNEYIACQKWRESVVAELKANPPALVVLSNYARATVADRSRSFADQWTAGLASVAGELAGSSAVTMVADTPSFPDTPAVCLSTHLSDADGCDAEPAVVLNSTLADEEKAALVDVGATVVDMTPYLCSTTVCPVIDGNLLMYRDNHHLTATFSAALADALGARILLASPALLMN
ncbi:acyltransferase family protein [Subtercola sp. Z020]|uniref:acyltransferase family protein n=1 Tax=Subtercola sp. Z020 TaxID=2080582 RepID=UPI001E2FA00A|nr:acyltransferase family protein [Subtercola sp. Z020]